MTGLCWDNGRGQQLGTRPAVRLANLEGPRAPERADRGQRLRTFVLLPHLLVGLDEVLFVGWWAGRQQMGHAGGSRTQRATAQGQPWRPLCPRRLRAHGLKRPPPPRPAPHPGCPTGGAGPGRPAADLPGSCTRCLAPLRGSLSLDPTHIQLQTLPCLLRNQMRLTELGQGGRFPSLPPLLQRLRPGQLHLVT